MQYNNYVVQDFDEDLGNTYEGYQGDEGYTRSVPTIYREVYTTNERLDFQNPNQPQRPTFGFRSDQQIEFKNTAKRNYQSEKGSRSKSKKKVAFSLPRKKKTAKFAPKRNKKTLKAYAKQAVVKKQQEPLQENRDWNTDTRTAGYFDKSLRKQLISHPMKDNLVKGKDIVDERDQSERNRGRQMRATAKPVYEEGKKDYYTDLYEFAERVSQMKTSPPRNAQGEAPKSAKKYSPRGEQPKKSAMKARTYSNPNLKQVSAEEVVETMVRDQEDARGKANPVFVRKAREMLEGKGNKNKFFVSMSVKRERLFVPRVRKNPKFSHVVAKLMHPTASTRSKMNAEPLEERQLRSKSPLEKVHKQDRIEQQQRIYLNEQGGQDMYPTREDGGYNMRDVRSYSEKQRAMRDYQEPVRGHYPTNQQEMYDQQYMYDQQQQQQNQQFYDPNQHMYDQQMYNQRYEDQNRYYQQQEIAKRVEADYMLDEYRNRLQERAQEPNVYFDRISRGLENLRQDFGAVSQNLQQTSAYMNNYNKKQTGSYQIAAKGAGKLVKLYSEQLTELLLDDLIFETIPILHEKEENEKKLMKNRKKKEMLQTCLEAFKDLTHEHQRVHERAEEIYTLTTMTKNRMKTLERETYTVPKKVLKKKIELSQPQVNVVKEYKEKFKNLKKTNELFSEKSHIMMDIIVRDMLDDLTRDVIGKVIEAQNELVERMFISEFDF